MTSAGQRKQIDGFASALMQLANDHNVIAPAMLVVLSDGVNVVKIDATTYEDSSDGQLVTDLDIEHYPLPTAADPTPEQ